MEQFLQNVLIGIRQWVNEKISDIINDSSLSDKATWSSSKINEEIQAVGGTADSEFDGKTTEDFRFVTELPQEATEGEQVVINGENIDTLYKYVSGAWEEQTPDATVLYFDTENEVLYSYVSTEQQFATISSVNTIIVGKNLNTSETLKAIKTPGTYSVLQRTSSTTKGEYTRKWTLTVEGVDYDEYDNSDSIYQRIQSNYTIQKRTWSATRVTNDGWSSFSTYYAGEIKDSTTSKYYTWSSNKLSGELATKQDVLTAGSNISISSNTISADGYVWNASTGGFSEKYKQDAGDGGQIVANTATGLGSHAEGYNTTASGDYGSHAEGCETSAIIDSAHAEGYGTTASGDYGSHAEGSCTSAIGNASHTEGYGTQNYPIQALGVGSHAEGVGRIAQNEAEHAEGMFGVSHKNSDNFGDAGNTLHSIGNSYSRNNFHNAVEVMQNGDVYITGVGGYDGVHIKGEDSGITVNTVQEVISGINTSVASKQDTLTAGNHISISANNEIDTTGVVTSQYIANIWRGTQDEYDALQTYENNTLYVIVEQQ